MNARVEAVRRRSGAVVWTRNYVDRGNTFQFRVVARSAGINIYEDSSELYRAEERLNYPIYFRGRANGLRYRATRNEP